MTPEHASQQLLGITRSKAKMFEYSVPIEDHIKIPKGADPANLFPLALAILGDYAAAIAGGFDEDGSSLRFSTRFFDAFLEAKQDPTLDPYLLLVGSAAYYLNERPGSSQVLARRLGAESPGLNGRQLENLLHWLLQNDWDVSLAGIRGRYEQVAGKVSEALREHAQTGGRSEDAHAAIKELTTTAYQFGSPRELLFSDLIAAVAKKRLQNSSWTCLPRYSSVDVSLWRPTLEKKSFTRELWPAQRLLGEKGVLSGSSAVVQFPTSAGKTHAVEMILRSGFLAGRARVAVVVAPFRALCHEISARLTEAFSGEDVKVDEVSDVLQMDLLAEVAEALAIALADAKTILVLTPEKLLYIFRHSPEITKHIGLLILDEGHQFDSGDRGVTFELLVTALKPLLSKRVQVILISAVIPNSQQIAEWLNGKDSLAVFGTNLLPTERSIAFSSWRTQRGQLHFVDPTDTTSDEFFVPRVLEQTDLKKKKGEKKTRTFPNRDDGQAIALYLGLKFVRQGSIAIFCGRKDSAAALADLLIELNEREHAFLKPVEVSDAVETGRLRLLHEKHFGSEAPLTQCAAWGVYLHHGNTPNGLRLAIEHAMKSGRARFVICTSTLAQGVNLPIRYLVVTSVYQGSDRIKVRDFHNLIGRTGRSGMHTEGTIVFSDPAIYDRRLGDENWRWRIVNELLAVDNVEPCNSSLLSLLDPLKSDDSRFVMKVTMQDFVERYVKDLDKLYEEIGKFADGHAKEGFTRDGLSRQVDWKVTLLSAIESYLMSHRAPTSEDTFPEESRALAQRTLAYFLATPDQKTELVEIFRMLASHIEGRVPEIANQQSYGKTLFGLYRAIAIENWTRGNLNKLVECESEDQLLDILWPLIAENMKHNLFQKCDKPSALVTLASSWIRGKSFAQIYSEFVATGAKRTWGKSKRNFRMDDVVDICENALGYEATLVVGGVADLLGSVRRDDQPNPTDFFMGLQKRLRYGLPDRLCIVIHEVGFSDRAVAMELRANLKPSDMSRSAVIAAIRETEAIRGRLDQFPAYFHQAYSNLAT